MSKNKQNAAQRVGSGCELSKKCPCSCHSYLVVDKAEAEADSCRTVRGCSGASSQRTFSVGRCADAVLIFSSDPHAICSLSMYLLTPSGAYPLTLFLRH